VGCAGRGLEVFLILTFFKLFIKLTLGKHFLHLVTTLAAPRRAARVAFAAPHAEAL
jgi:hypothetical protein